MSALNAAVVFCLAFVSASRLSLPRVCHSEHFLVIISQSGHCLGYSERSEGIHR